MIRPLVGVLLGAVLLAACGDDDSPAADGPPSGETSCVDPARDPLMITRNADLGSAEEGQVDRDQGGDIRRATLTVTDADLEIEVDLLALPAPSQVSVVSIEIGDVGAELGDRVRLSARHEDGDWRATADRFDTGERFGSPTAPEVTDTSVSWSMPLAEMGLAETFSWAAATEHDVGLQFPVDQLIQDICPGAGGLTSEWQPYP